MPVINNPILNVDSYKHGHYLMYPPTAERLYSYVEARPGGRFDKTLFFGMGGFLSKLMQQFTLDDIEQADSVLKQHGTHFDAARWRRILDKYNGVFPVEICALPEGSVVPVGTPLVTIVDTDPEFIGIGSFLETQLLRAIWYPTTVATLSYHCKQIIKDFFEKSSDSNVVDFQLHDFGGRGVSSFESACIGGGAHLLNFEGTDTLSGILYNNHHYGSGICGHSINAAEHSTVTAWGKNGEAAFLSNLIDKFGGPGKMVAFPCDSYDMYRMVRHTVGVELKDKILNSGTIIVVRTDSGNPIWVPLDVIEILGEKFGYIENSKGYRVLHPQVRVIQGDGITIDTIPQIYGNIVQRGWSAENLALGMGGGLLQQVNRDTLSFAMKASAIYIDGDWRKIGKEPKTDPSKKSKMGRFYVKHNYENGEWQTLSLTHKHNEKNNRLKQVYLMNKDMLYPNIHFEDFETIRSRCQ